MDLREKLNFEEVFGVPQTVVHSAQAAPSSQAINSALKNAEKQVLNQLEPELSQMTQTIFTDPCFNISPSDSDLWLFLFTQARKISHELHAILFYLRSIGVVLVPSKKYGYMIKPLIDPDNKRGFANKDAYNQEKQYLDPYKKEVILLLEELKRWKDGEKVWR